MDLDSLIVRAQAQEWQKYGFAPHSKRKVKAAYCDESMQFPKERETELDLILHISVKC